MNKVLCLQAQRKAILATLKNYHILFGLLGLKFDYFGLKLDFFWPETWLFLLSLDRNLAIIFG